MSGERGLKDAKPFQAPDDFRRSVNFYSLTGVAITRMWNGDWFYGVDTTAADVTVTLPPVGDEVGHHHIVKRISGGSNQCNIASASGLLEHSATHSLAAQDDLRIYFSDGTAYRLLQASIPQFGAAGTASFASAVQVSGSFDVSATASFGATPVFPTGSFWEKIDEASLSSVASYTKDSIASRFNHLRVTFSIRPATDGDTFVMVLRKASGTDITSYDRSLVAATGSAAVGVNQLAQTTVTLSSTIENTSPQGIVSGEIIINNIQSSDHKGGTWSSSTFTNAGELIAVAGAFKCNDTAVLTGIKFLCAGGNITAGRIRLEGC